MAKISDEVTLSFIGSSVTNRVSGWKDIRITRGIERMPSDFEVSMSERFPGVTQTIAAPGIECLVHVGADLVVSSYVDRVESSIAFESHDVKVTGRGYCQDLVDCSAVWQGGLFNNQNVLQIAQALAKPYSISVSLGASGVAGDPIPQVQISPGESPFDIIARCCQYRALLCYEDQNGQMILGRAGEVGASGGLEQGVNVEAASFAWSQDQRYSDYVVVNQGVGLFNDTGTLPLAAFTTHDSTVSRFRLMYLDVLAGDPGLTVSKQRAVWEANRRLGRGFMLNVRTDSWRDLDGNLWAPNTTVPVSIPALKIPDQSWLIGEVTYRFGLDGKHCDLTIMPIPAFGVEPVVFNPYDPQLAAAQAAINDQ